MIVIDGNAIGYAAQYSRRLLVDGREVQAIYQFLRTLKSIRQRFAADGEILVLWDGRAEFRYDLYPEYKGKRNKTEEQRRAKESWKEQSTDVKTLLSLLNVSQAVNYDYEADDLAGLFVRRAKKDIRLITGDQDWMQLISPTVTWHDVRSDQLKDCNFKDFERVTGYKTTTQFLVGKALHGDTSDNITGVGGLGEKASVEIMREYGGISNLIKRHRETGGLTKETLPPGLSRFKKKINDFCTGDGRKLLVRNLQLMDLKSSTRDADILKGLRITKSAPNLPEFMSQCRDLNFLSIVGQSNQWQIFNRSK